MKKQAWYVMLAVSSVALAGCYGGGSSSTGESSESESGAAEQVFNLVVPQEMPSADLSLATDTISFAALNNVYEGLYRLGEGNKVEAAGAAELAEVSEDGLTYKLKLREDAKWSNGEPVVAADYVYGWQRTVSPETASEYAYLFESVANAAEVTAGEKDADELGIKAVSDYELEITLKNPTPYFDYLLAFPSFFPQSQAVVEEYGDKYASNSETAVYNGPFTLVDFDGPGTDTEWVYQKNETYWDVDTVQLDTINVSVVKESSTALNLFKDNQADDVILSGELAQQNANEDAFVTVNEATTIYFEYNQSEKDSPFRNINVRKAIASAIDREALVTKVLGDGSIIANGLVPSGMSVNPDTGEDFAEESGELITYDLEKATQYWETAKSELGIDSLTFEMIASDTDSNKKILEYIQNAVQEALPGITIKPQPVPLTVRLDRATAGDFEVVLGGWGADYVDPSSFTDLFTTGNSYNQGKWSNEDYDKLIASASGEHAGDPAKRWADLIAANKIIGEDMGVVPLYQKAEAHLVNPKIKGIVHHAAGAGWDYKWTYIAE